MNHLQGFGLFFLIGGLIGVCGAIEQAFRKRALVRRAVAVNAQIVDVVSDGITEDSEVTWYYPVVAFTVGGKPFRVKLTQGTVRRDDHRVGKAIRVYFDPRDPSQAVARLRDFPGGGLALVLGAVIAAIGAGLCWVGWKS